LIDNHEIGWIPDPNVSVIWTYINQGQMSRGSNSNSNSPKRRGKTLTKYNGAKGPGYVSKLSKFSQNPSGFRKRPSIRKSIVGRKSIMGH